MKKMLMLGTSKMSREIVKYAKQKGYYTIVTDYQEPDRSLAKQISDEYWMINTADVDAIVCDCLWGSLHCHCCHCHLPVTCSDHCD